MLTPDSFKWFIFAQALTDKWCSSPNKKCCKIYESRFWHCSICRRSVLLYIKYIIMLSLKPDRDEDQWEEYFHIRQVQKCRKTKWYRKKQKTNIGMETHAQNVGIWNCERIVRVRNERDLDAGLQGMLRSTEKLE